MDAFGYGEKSKAYQSPRGSRRKAGGNRDGAKRTLSEFNEPTLNARLITALDRAHDYPLCGASAKLCFSNS